MKNILLLIAISILISSCLYKDGPVISLRLKSERLANTWKYDNYLINNLNVTEYFDSSTLQITKDGFIYKTNILKDSTTTTIGKWEFDENTSQVLKMYLIDSTLSTWAESWTIFRLLEEEVWLENRTGTEIHELILKPL